MCKEYMGMYRRVDDVWVCNTCEFNLGVCVGSMYVFKGYVFGCTFGVCDVCVGIVCTCNVCT